MIDIFEDEIYQLSPKAVRWYKLRKKQEAFQISVNDEQVLMLLEREMGIDSFEYGPVNVEVAEKK